MGQILGRSPQAARGTRHPAWHWRQPVTRNALQPARAAGCRRFVHKRFETVVASFGAPAAGGVFVPMNPLLKPEQVAYIARDCNVRVLVTSPERLALLAPLLDQCPDLRMWC
jgi:acyl-CoA synthetase (AMP-forming)/AMP-acid ligase II